MLSETKESGVAITKVHRVLLVTMQPDLDDAQLQHLNILLGERVTEEKPIAVVLDFSTVELLSLSEYERIHAMLLALRLLGAQVGISSLCSEIVIYLAEVDAASPEIRFFLSLEDAMHYFAPEGDRSHGGQ
ncbi:MAG: hypothetical protein VKN15_06940 [Cyanobacteriota bacterium]|nr:hypothetical protein [Cyanobacteriota bacterium]